MPAHSDPSVSRRILKAGSPPQWPAHSAMIIGAAVAGVPVGEIPDGRNLVRRQAAQIRVGVAVHELDCVFPEETDIPVWLAEVIAGDVPIGILALDEGQLREDQRLGFVPRPARRPGPARSSGSRIGWPASRHSERQCRRDGSPTMCAFPGSSRTHMACAESRRCARCTDAGASLRPTGHGSVFPTAGRTPRFSQASTTRSFSQACFRL